MSAKELSDSTRAEAAAYDVRYGTSFAQMIEHDLNEIEHRRGAAREIIERWQEHGLISALGACQFSEGRGDFAAGTAKWLAATATLMMVAWRSGGHVFAGSKIGGVPSVTDNGEPLHHTPFMPRTTADSRDPFAWGMCSGTATWPPMVDLAYALLRAVGLDHEQAAEFAGPFGFNVLGVVPASWTMTADEINEWIAKVS